MNGSLVEIDGRHVHRSFEADADVVIVGSGPAGASAARALAAKRVRVIVLEEGHQSNPSDFVGSGVRAMAALYRDMGTSIAFGNVSMPYLQGCAVGGTSVVNGAISWNLPPEALAEWIQRDPGLEKTLAPERVAAVEAGIEARLNIHPTDVRVAGAKNLLLARGADALGVANRPIRRNVQGCVGEGRCLQGCPHGNKLSMDRSFLPDAVTSGARIFSGMRVERVLTTGNRAWGVSGVTSGGAKFEVTAQHAVVLAASAIQTPCLLRQSGITQGPVGDGLCGHPGVSVTGHFDDPVHNWRGATQGHEVTGYRSEGIKIETLGFDISLLATRIPGAGKDFARRLATMEHYAVWGAALRAKARGRVRPGWKRPIVMYSLTAEDIKLARRAVRLLGDTLLAAGATEVYPGIPGFDAVVRDRAHMARFEEQGSLVPGDYAMSMTHLFGTARMGSDPATSVVRPDFRHHSVTGLYIADSSVFPGNLGVNPQIPIMAFAELCANSVVQA